MNGPNFSERVQRHGFQETRFLDCMPDTYLHMSTGQSRHWLASVLACYGSMLGPPLECTTICRPVPLVHPNLFFFNTAFLPTQRSVPY